jgi:peroxiredoxin
VRGVMGSAELRRGFVTVLLLTATAGQGGGFPSPAFGQGVPGDAGTVKSIPPLDLVSLQGTTYSFFTGSPLSVPAIFFFFEPRSAAGVLEMTFLERLYPNIRNKGVRVIAVEASGLKKKEVRLAMEKYRRLFPGPSFPVIPDPSYRLSRLFQVDEVPSTYVVGSGGDVRCCVKGFSQEKQVDLTKKIISSLSKGSEAQKTLMKLGETDKAEAADAEQEEESMEMVEAGSRIPPLTMTDLKGAPVGASWSAEGARVNIVFFWGAMCLPCMREMTYLDEMYRKAKGRGLRVFGVQAGSLSPERTAVVMERYARVYPGPAFPIVPDADERLRLAFGVKPGGPATFFIDREGVVTFATDEFPQGYETILAMKIERALQLGSEAIQLSGDADLGAGRGAGGPESSIHQDRREFFNENVSRGDYYFSIGRFEEALPFYLKALSVDPASLHVLPKVAHIYEREGHTRAALEQWKKILDLDTNHAEALEHVSSLSGR